MEQIERRSKAAGQGRGVVQRRFRVSTEINRDENAKDGGIHEYPQWREHIGPSYMTVEHPACQLSLLGSAAAVSEVTMVPRGDEGARVTSLPRS